MAEEGIAPIMAMQEGFLRVTRESPGAKPRENPQQGKRKVYVPMSVGLTTLIDQKPAAKSRLVAVYSKSGKRVVYPDELIGTLLNARA